jgi:eukaryotic translation initiation factor 2C
VRRPYQTKTFKVELCFAGKIPMAAIAQAIRGQESENSLEALRVLDIILRQHSAKQYVSFVNVLLNFQSSLLCLGFYMTYILRLWLILLTIHRGCLLVRQSSFHNNPSSFVDLGGGVMGCRGFHSSFRGTQSGLSLNIGMHLTLYHSVVHFAMATVRFYILMS